MNGCGECGQSLWWGGGWGEKDMLSLQAVFGGMSQDLKLLIQDHLQV